MNEVRAGTLRVLRDNPLWRNQILRILDELLPDEPDVTASLSIFIRTISVLLTRDTVTYRTIC
jgi:hypothetical protein